MSRERVMLVHYNPRQVDALSRALESAGLKVDVCADGMTALSSLSSIQPDLIILEAMIPKKNGFEVCREIKSRPDGKDIPVIITSDIHRGRRYRSDAMTVYGCQEFLERGFTPEQLVQTVGRLLPGALLESPDPGAASDALNSGDASAAVASGETEPGATTEFDEGEINTLLDTIFPSDDASDLAARLRSRQEALSTEEAPLEAGPREAAPRETASSAAADESGPFARSASGPRTGPADESWSFGEIDTSAMQDEFDLPSLLPPVEEKHRDSRLIEALESMDSPAARPERVSSAVATLEDRPPEEPHPALQIETATAESRMEDVVASMRRERGEQSALEFPQTSAAPGYDRPRSGAPRMIPLLAAAIVGFSAIGASAWWQLRPAPPPNAAANAPLAIESTPSPEPASGLFSNPVSASADHTARAARAARKAVPSAGKAAPGAPSVPVAIDSGAAPASSNAAPSAPAGTGNSAVPAANAAVPEIEADPAGTPAADDSGGGIALEAGPSGFDSDASPDAGAEGVASVVSIEDSAATGFGSLMPVRTLATEPGALINIGEADVRPSHVSTPPPAYPASARMLRIYGDVTLQVLVQENGSVGDVRVLSSPSPALAEAALNAVRAWRYTPAQKDGVRVRTWMNEQINFRLK